MNAMENIIPIGCSPNVPSGHRKQLILEVGSVITVTEALIDRLAMALALESLTEDGRANHNWPSEDLWHPDEVRHYRELAVSILSGQDIS